MKPADELRKMSPRIGRNGLPHDADTADDVAALLDECERVLDALLIGGMDVSHTALILSRNSETAERKIKAARATLAKLRGEA